MIGCSCSLQQFYTANALTFASMMGHTEIVYALLTAGIDITDVSIYPLTPSHVVVGGEGWGRFTSPCLHPNPRTN